MKLRLPGRAEEPAQAPALEDFAWVDPPDQPPEEPPSPDPWAPRPPHRRRRLIALAVLVALGGVGVALLVGGSGDKPLSKRERSQLEAAAPGSSKQGRKASLAVPAAVRRATAALPLPRAVAQLFVVGTEAQYPADPFFERLRKRDWGAIVISQGNVVDQGQAAALTGELGVVARQSRHLAPLVVADQPGGPNSAFPDLPPRAQPLAGESGAAKVRDDAREAARSLRDLGFRMTLAPVADVGTAVGPVEDEVFSDDARRVARLTAAAVEGYRRGRVVAAVGHFPGQGSASADPDVANATVGLSLPELRRRDLRPFAAIASGAPVVVMSNAVYAAWDGVTPATVLPEVVGGLLRGDLHYRGVVMTPDLTSTAPILGVGVGTAAVQAVEAGADMLYVSGGPAQQDAAYRGVLRAVRKGRISRERLRLSLQRVLTLKHRYGLSVTVRGRAAGQAAARPNQRGR